MCNSASPSPNIHLTLQSRAALTYWNVLRYKILHSAHRVHSCHLTLYVLRASVTHKHVYYKLTAGICDLQKCCYIFRLQTVVILRKPECTNICIQLSCDLPIVNGKTYISVTLLLNENVFCGSHCIKIIIQSGC